jgi:hypothetical protein
MTPDSNLDAGARNLLENCAGASRGQRVLIVHEDPGLGWYDLAAPQAVAARARDMGLDVSMLPVGAPASQRAPRVTQAMAEHDHTVFFARIGDQERFTQDALNCSSVMCYARDAAALGSRYGLTDHRAMRALKDAVDGVTARAQRIDITCPLGTEYGGSPPDPQPGEAADVAVRRFPLGVPQPVSASGFSGRVALARWLTPTCSQPYDPPSIALDETVFAVVDYGRITGFEGHAGTVARVRAHYARVADLLGIDPDFVHSWHAGIHPGSVYVARAGDDPDRWSNSVFTNPRWLHFHTCGRYAPGEICWMLLDHSVSIDGTPLWSQGRLQPQAFEETARCVRQWPELVDLIADPSDQIGL